MTATERTVAILGGGVGGIVAANRLRARLPRRDRVVLVTRDAQHVFQPSLLWLADGSRAARDVQRPVARLRSKGVDVRTDEVLLIDPAARRVETTRETLSSDAIVIALGADLAPETIPGLAEAGHNLYTLPGATAIREALNSMRRGRVVVLTASPAYKCPAAPYEAAMLFSALFRDRGLADAVTVEIFAAEPAPLGVAGPEVGASVRALLHASGIAYRPGQQVHRVDASARTIAFADGSSTTYDLLVYVPPHRAPSAIMKSGLAGASGWMDVDRHTFETAWPMVFAIGDVTTVPLAIGKPLPKAGVFAHAQAEVVARNLARAWTGQGASRRFDGHGQCFLETGNGRAGVGSGNFYGEPVPRVVFRRPSRRWHWAKVLFEYWWLRRWF